MARCDVCLANKVCDRDRFSFENCGFYIHTEDYEALKRTGERYAQVKEYIDHIILDSCDYSDGVAYENAFRNELDKLLKNKSEVAFEHYHNGLRDAAKRIFEAFESAKVSLGGLKTKVYKIAPFGKVEERIIEGDVIAFSDIVKIIRKYTEPRTESKEGSD